MAYHGPSYGLSRECAMKSQAKFSIERAQASLSWLEADGILLCELINKLNPGSVKKINTLNTPFKHRENIELYLKGCENYGIKPQDLFQVNDLYENKNLYMIVDNLFVIGGLAQKKGYEGPVIGAKMATSNKRNFDDDVLKAGQNVIGLQYGSNKGASQAGMTAYGTGRQIRPDEIGQN
ncbi:TAGLN [Lepeophtheirus salmonis]|uniref:Calponin n=1 Tax=Lepeophtheirus salmonis TaxID=72036 RepID=A0A7R8D3C6_LEPSM|nr:TAGLN [Lepeophtheirus salmonis]CAF2983457.1 TAGLN [Lepeophtheirus salmonis]